MHAQYLTHGLITFFAHALHSRQAPITKPSSLNAPCRTLLSHAPVPRTRADRPHPRRHGRPAPLAGPARCCPAGSPPAPPRCSCPGTRTAGACWECTCAPGRVHHQHSTSSRSLSMCAAVALQQLCRYEIGHHAKPHPGSPQCGTVVHVTRTVFSLQGPGINQEDGA